MVKRAEQANDFPHMRAALNAAESVTPGNELQEYAAADIIRLAFEMEVRAAFPEETADRPIPPAL